MHPSPTPWPFPASTAAQPSGPTPRTPPGPGTAPLPPDGPPLDEDASHPNDDEEGAVSRAH